ncbi:MAG: HPr family phosphocarrier protein [Lachnospiraceae bacterium]|nr:HPr family phosphocarrier protein [Lachnospiraceae bacterium]
MSKRRIKMNTVDDVRIFVKAADKCIFPVNITFDGRMIDAKSIMGVMSLDLTQELTVSYSEEDAELERVLNQFACA